MSSTKFSDLPFNVAGDNVVLLQPDTTRMLSKEDFLKRGNFQDIFNDMVNRVRLTHAGTLSCYNYCDTPGEPIHWKPCGGISQIRSVEAAGLSEWMEGRANFAITCSDSRCNMKLGIRDLSESEIANMMFHLMLKQMIPLLKTCNYVDCTPADFRFPHNDEDVKPVRALGVVSLASQALWGVMDDGYHSKFVNDYSLGFMLMPGMKTTSSCDGFDEWLKFLVQKKFESLQKYHVAMPSVLLGPKPRTRDR